MCKLGQGGVPAEGNSSGGMEREFSTASLPAAGRMSTRVLKSSSEWCAHYPLQKGWCHLSFRDLFPHSHQAVVNDGGYLWSTFAQWSLRRKGQGDLRTNAGKAKRRIWPLNWDPKE